MMALGHLLELLKLTLPFQFCTGYRLLGDLFDKTFFELEEAPFLGECLVTPIQLDQEEISQYGQHHQESERSASLATCLCSRCNPLFNYRHLYLPDIMPPLVHTFTR